MKDYDIYANNMSVRFNCPECGNVITHQLCNPAKPNWEGDTVAKSQEIEDEYVECPECHTPYNIETIANIYYGEMRLTNTKTNNEIKNFEINYNTKDKTTMKNFNNWFSEQIATQYSDMKGIAYLDGHEGPGEVKKMLQDCGVDTKKYTVLGFHFYGFEPVGEHIHSTAYIVEKSVISAKGGVENLDYNTDVEEFVLENFDWDVMKRYIKRLSIGFIMPEHLQ